MNILIVEDDKIQLNGLKDLLLQYYPSYMIYLANTYEEAITHIDSRLINIFLLDIDLKEGEQKNGVQIANYIRMQQRYSFTPILFLSAVQNNILATVNQTHCYCYIKKPYSNDVLLEQFHTLVETLKNSPLVSTPTIDIKEIHGNRFRIPVSSIQYIEILGHKLTIYTEEETFSTTEYTSKELHSTCLIFQSSTKSSPYLYKKQNNDFQKQIPFVDIYL